MTKKKYYTTTIKGVKVHSNDPEAHWEHMQEMRNQLLKLHFSRCENCGEKVTMKSAHVHHRHYKSFGYEKLEDLSLMCKHCHKQYHRRARNGRLVPSDMKFITPEMEEYIRMQCAWRWKQEGLIE